jgi:signal transduction histidine kinase
MVVETSTSVPIQSRRKAVHSLVDHTLRFATNHEVLSEWLNSGPLIGRLLTELFPEIKGFEAAIHELQQSDVLTIPDIRRLNSETQEIIFDLQLEPAPHLGSIYTLTLIDVTEQAYFREYIRQQSEGLHQQFRWQQNGFRVVELEQHNRNLHLLNQASRTLITTLAKQAVLDQLLEVATEIIHAEGSSIWLWADDKDDELICQAVYHSEEAPALLNQRLKLGQGVGGTAVATEQIIVVQDTRQDERFYSDIDERTGITTTSIMAVPLQFHDTSLGVLELVNKVEGTFTVEDQAMAETLATFASVAIYNAQLVGSLQESNEELDSFAHTVAHDLQNTLSIVIGFAELLRRDDTRLTEDRRKQMAKALVINTYKMSNIIKELLLLSSVRKSDVAIEPLNMQQIVEAALLRLSYTLEDYKPEVVIQEQWPVALGHAAWIEEIWENYISNALKYGGQLPRVECGGEKLADGRVRFWVRDNGPGLTAEEQARLFDPFIQLSKVRVKGSGLGLSIVQRIANKLGGEVGVESEIGQGSLFSFILPQAEE